MVLHLSQINLCTSFLKPIAAATANELHILEVGCRSCSAAPWPECRFNLRPYNQLTCLFDKNWYGTGVVRRGSNGKKRDETPNRSSDLRG